MKKICALWILMTLSAVSVAEDVMIMNVQKVVRDAKYTENEKQKLRNGEEFRALEARIAELKKEISKLRDEFKANELVWTDEQKLAQQKNIQEKFIEGEQQTRKQFALVQQKEQEVLKALQPKINEVTQILVKEKGIKVLLDRQTVHFYETDLDITDEVIERLNKAVQ